MKKACGLKSKKREAGILSPQWTRARPLKQKSIIDNIIVTDFNLLQVSGNVQVDTMDIGKLNHFLSGMDGIG